MNSLDESIVNARDTKLISIVLPKEYQVSFNNAGTFRARTFYSLNKLKNDYDYILVSDLHSAAVKNVNLHKLFDNFFAQKVLWGNPTTGTDIKIEWIKMSCAKWFANTLDWQKLWSPLYLWTNQPYLYRTDTLDEFFEITEILDNLTAIAWTDFPYYIYMYYLILYRNFKIRDIGLKVITGVCESNSLGNIKSKNPDFKPMSCRKSISRLLDSDNLFMVTGI